MTGLYMQHSAAATFTPLAANFVCECERSLWIWDAVSFVMYIAVCVCIRVGVCDRKLFMIMWCVWICDREHQPFIKSVAPALTFTPPPKCFCGVYLPPLGHRQHPSSFCLRCSAAKMPCWGGDGLTALLQVKQSAVKDAQYQLVTARPSFQLC